MYYIDTNSLKNIEAPKEIIDVFNEMNCALNINNNIDANLFIEEIKNKYEKEFEIYDSYNPINKYPKGERIKYIWQFLFAVAFKKIMDLKNKGNHQNEKE